ncbi:WD40 repeat-like protein [Aureobasidium pullulans]|uniref:WD40 repeat-like protein n=1 Tax=Aureobasidium pullulans TaxID=5580 RepID=A0A4S8Y8N6_AURPU|nr:WD40 repeat-like protein [Aureobasidium pullulans]THV94285.1 WD40 repeat-like protein [Aureobasidium pullulans]THV99021.1 WD40 repeat-like protein [Aureobasidium pullulans]THW09009.1 WD40 repeat-like protein [Aureobasidium pullulans]THW21634.1 WD40 repeat-like protein [Aureobasidium pullulans]
MAAEVQSLQPLKLAAGPEAITADQRYWKGFRSQQLVPSPHSNPITHISFPPSPTNPLVTPPSDTFAVTSGSRVQIFSSKTRKLLKTITRFGYDDIAHSGEIRRDGRVLVAGGDSGAIQAFDTGSRAILKTWKEHKQPVWVTRWNPNDLTSIMSCSDDKTVRLWDLPSESSMTTFSGHQDYVRSGAFMPGQSSNLIVSGSYDQTVRLWDSRAPKRAVMTFKHAAAIESVLPMPSGTQVLASADNQISVLDLVAGKPLHLIKNHQKTVTSLCLANNGTRLVSGGLDGHVKVFETSAWNVVAGFKYPSPVLSLSVVGAGASREDRHLAVGMQSGLLSVRTRLSGEQKAAAREKEKEMQALVAGTIEEYDRKKAKKLRQGDKKALRGRDFTGEGADIVIDGNARGNIRNQSKWESALRNGKYALAVDMVLGATKFYNPNMLTLLTALRHRSAMRTAFKGRDETSLQPILRWVIKYIGHPRYIKLTSDVAMLLLDLYSEQAMDSPEIDDLLNQLHRKVRHCSELAQAAYSTQGMLDLLVSGA